MERISNYLENQLDSLVEELRFFDARSQKQEICETEKSIAYIDYFIEEVKDMIAEKEINVLKFDNDGNFKLWCIRQPEGEDLIIEEYADEINFENFDLLAEETDCIDVTDTFLIENILPHIELYADSDNCDYDINKYYLASNFDIDNAKY